MERYSLFICLGSAKPKEKYKEILTADLGFCNSLYQSSLLLFCENEVIYETGEVKWKKFVDDGITNDGTKCTGHKLSDAVHSLLDQLPNYGTYLLEIWIDGDLCQILSNDNAKVHLFGAFLRCVSWHNGLIFFFSDDDVRVPDSWMIFLRSCVISLKDGITNHRNLAVIWRGSLRIGTPDSEIGGSVPGFEMVGQSKEYSCFMKNEKEMPIVKDEMLVLQACNVTSVLPYLVTPDKFQLHVPVQRHGCESAKKLIGFLNSNPDLCFVARLPYAVYRNPKNLRPQSSSKTEAWKTMVLNSNLKDFTRCNETDVDYDHEVHFLLFADGSHATPSGVTAIRMRHPLEMDLAFSTMPGNIASKDSVNEEYRKCAENLLNDLPRIGPERSHVLRPQQQQAADPNDWPERRYLLLRSCKEKKNSALTSNSESMSLLANDFEAGDVLSLFECTGEGKDKDAMVTMCKTKRSAKPYNSLEEIQSTSWPDVVHCHFHDLYYNVGKESEEKERLCNRIRERCIESETASTCESSRSFDRATARLSCKRKRNVSNLQRPLAATKIRQSQSDGVTGTADNEKEIVLRSPRRCFKEQATKSQEVVSKVAKTERKTKCSQNQKDLSEKHKMKLREAVVTALEKEGITTDHATFKACGRRLFNVCTTFVSDVIGKGRTSVLMKKIATAHVKQVIEFENLKRDAKIF